MPAQRDARDSSIFLVSVLAGAILLLLMVEMAAPAGEPPVLVRILVRGGRSVTTEAGVLLADEAGDLRILDLRTGQERTFKKSQIRSVTNPATEQDVAAVTGLAPLVSWFIAEALPSRPKAGQIASVDGAVAYINRGAAVGVREGERFDVFRGDGQDIVDPETGEVLGSTQKRIGQAEVVELHEKLSKIRLTGEFEVDLAVGDVVRPVSAEATVAVLPLGRDSGQVIQGGVQLAEQITSGLTKNGVAVVERTALDKVLAEQSLAGTGRFDTDTLQRVGKLLQAQAIVTGTIQLNGKDANVNVRLIEVETGKVLYATSLTAKGISATPVTSTIPKSVAPATPAAAAANAGAVQLHEVQRFVGHVGPIRSAVFSPDGKRIASGGYDLTIRIWDVETGRQIRRMNHPPGEHTKLILPIRFTPDGSRVVSLAYGELGVRIWDLNTGRLLRHLDEKSPIRGMAVSAEDNLLFTCGQTGVRVFDLTSYKPLGSFESDYIWSVAPLTGSRLVAGHTDGKLQIWDWRRGEVVQRMQGHDGAITSLDLSSDGRQLASSSYDTTVGLWDLATGEPVWKFNNHSTRVGRVRFVPGRPWVVSGAYDQILSVCDTNLLTEIGRLTADTHCTNWIDIAPDGQSVLSCGGDYQMPDGTDEVDDAVIYRWAIAHE